jgi:hypothetical protein
MGRRSKVILTPGFRGRARMYYVAAEEVSVSIEVTASSRSVLTPGGCMRPGGNGDSGAIEKTLGVPGGIGNGMDIALRPVLSTAVWEDSELIRLAGAVAATKEPCCFRG